MPTEIVQLIGYDGPNLRGPRPGVFLRVRSGRDIARRLRDALKDAALTAGVVLGYLDVEAEQSEGAYIISASFTTPTPALGVELAHYVVELLNRRAAGDEEWDADGPLWDLQKRRRAEALALPALQLIAEARSRGVPTLVRADELVQIGYGTRGWAFEAAHAPAAADVPWERVGPIPIIAVAGAAGEMAARLVAATLSAQGQAVGFAADADFDATRDLLSDPRAAIAVVDLAPGGMARRGLAFDRCAYSAVTDLPAELPPDVAGRAELARVLGVPMLLTDHAGAVALNADVPEIAALAEYAPCPIIYISAAAENAVVGFHRAEGGQALFVRDGAVVAATGAAEQIVAAATVPPEQLPGTLAGLALLWAMGLTWQQIISAG